MKEQTCIADYEQFIAASDNLYKTVLAVINYIKKYRDYGDGNPLNLVEIRTLDLIDKNPGIRISDVAKSWNHSLCMASRNVDRLHKKDYIIKRKEEGNDKDIHLYVTREGSYLAERYRNFDDQEVQAFAEYMQDKCTIEEFAEFYKVFELIREYYQQKVK